MYLFAMQEQRTNWWTQQGKKRVGKTEKLAFEFETYTHANREPVGSCCITQVAQLEALCQLWESGNRAWGAGSGRVTPERGGYMYTYD